MKRKLKYVYYEDCLDSPIELGEDYNIGDIIELEDGVFEVLEVQDYQKDEASPIFLNVPSKLEKIK